MKRVRKSKSIEFKEDHLEFEKGKKLEHLKEKARKISIKEGAFANIAGGFGSSYITPFALALQATNVQIGFLTSFSNLISPLGQLLGSRLMESYSRKKLVVWFVFLQALMWLPIAALGYLFYKGIFQEYLPIALIALFGILVAFGGIAHPSWFSWMGDIVDEKKRGKYFGKRNGIGGFFSLISALLAAFLLDLFKTGGFVLIGFGILFAVAFTARMISSFLFTKQFSPKFKLKKGYYFSFWNFIKTFDNFGKFAFYRAFFYFAIMIAGPFYAVYMLEELNFSYITFTIVTMSVMVFYLIFLPFVGKFSDRFGNVKLFYLEAFLAVLYPISWMFFKHPLALIFVPQLIGGIMTAAGVIGANNFVYDSVSRQHIPICSAYKNLLLGKGIFLGAILGGFLTKVAPSSFSSVFFFVFFVSAIARVIVPLVFLPFIKEERRVKHLPPMHIDLHHPTHFVSQEVSWFRKVFK